MRGDMDFDDTWLAFSLLDSKAGANWVTTKRFESQWLNLVKIVCRVDGQGRVVRQNKRTISINPLYAFLEIVHSTVVTMKTNRYGGLRNHLAVAVVFNFL